MSLVDFQARLKNARNEQGMTQKALAAKLGVTEQAVSKWERGNSYPDIEMLDQIAEILDCSLDYLFQYEKGRKKFGDRENLEEKRAIDQSICKDIIRLRFGMGLVDLIVEEHKKGFSGLSAMRQNIATAWGIRIPSIRMMDSMDCEKNEYQIEIYGRTVQCVKNFDGAQEDAMAQIWAHLQECIFANLDCVLNKQSVFDMVMLVREKYPAVVDDFVPGKCTYGELRRVLLEVLWRRHYAVDNLTAILQIMEENWEEELDVEKMADFIVEGLGEAYQI